MCHRPPRAGGKVVKSRVICATETAAALNERVSVGWEETLHWENYLDEASTSVWTRTDQCLTVLSPAVRSGYAAIMKNEKLSYTVLSFLWTSGTGRKHCYLCASPAQGFSAVQRDTMHSRCGVFPHKVYLKEFFNKSNFQIYLQSY